MKTIKLILKVECTDSTSVKDLVSDLKDGLLCDNVKKGIISYTLADGFPYLEEFENPDFEED